MRFTLPGDDDVVRFGLWSDDVVLDLSETYGTWGGFLEASLGSPSEIRNGGTWPEYPSEDVRVLVPVTNGNKVLCAALNYSEHTAESRTGQPDRPILFMKTSQSLIPSGAEIHGLEVSNQLDYESELALVIGRAATRVSADEASDYIAGYTLLNDVSARDLLQVVTGDRVRNDYFSAKCLDRSSPIGPSVVTVDEFGSLDDVELRGFLNENLVQSSNLDAMVHGIGELIAFASSRSTLVPGDVISTGTPGGVGKARGRFLQPGDTFEVRCGPIPPLRNSVADGG